MRMMPEKKKCMSVLDLRVAADQNDFELLLRQTSDQYKPADHDHSSSRC